MYFFTPMCFICLQSKSDSRVYNAEMLTKLQYCLETTEDFIPPTCDQAKMCNDCLSKLDAAFYFKKMCLNNIVQFNYYLHQLEQVPNKFNPAKVMSVELIDINKWKGVLESNKFTDFNQERYPDEQLETAFIKEELLNEFYFAGYTNNRTQDIFLDEDVKLSQAEGIIRNELQNKDESVKIDEHSDVQIEEVFVKSEILNVIYLPLCEVSKSPEHYSEEELKLLLNKKEILGDYIEKKEDEPKSTSEFIPSQFQKPSEIVYNESFTKEVTFICATCEKHFSAKRDIIRHVWIHSKLKLHCCDKCEKRFKTISGLKRHLLSHNNESSHSCSVCMKSFTYKSTLKGHMLIHSNKRPYSCLVCSKSFTQKSNLNQHMLIHSSERSYSCSVCKKKFTQNSSLNKHMLIHSNKRSHTCSVCRKSFTLKTNLDKHALIHTNERPHSCSVCMKRFTQKSTLNTHVLNHSYNSYKYLS